MTRRPATRAQLLARLPRAFRPKLDAGQQRDLGLCHIVNLDAIARGEATEQLLWDWVAAVLLWSRVAEQLQVGLDEMTAQLELAHSLIERYGRTGRILFDGPGYQLAKQGVDVMDQLALIVDRPTAIAAADWGEAKVNEMAAACRARPQMPADQRRAA